jgi:hypothetical protein
MRRPGVAVYYTLPVNIGCDTEAHEQAKWFGDDIALKSDKYVYGVHGLRSAAAGREALSPEEAAAQLRANTFGISCLLRSA